ncbi:MAG TPA: radical SAM protein [Terriglobales bacterium]|nr:radical SAM protein [Terriglobales bacterium]
MTRSTPKVVLFYPPYDGPPLSAPLCLLTLASSLRKAGFQPVIIDAAIDSNYRASCLREAKDAICVGISVLTGPMILGAIEIANSLRSHLPHVPIAFGGWHPSLLPEQTLREPFVDFIVRGQGEITLVELASALRDHAETSGIAGLSWKSGSEIVHNPSRRVELLDSLPTPAFDLAQVDAYERVTGIRKLAYATSVGCPYACNYCTDMVFYKRRFNALSAGRVVEEMIGLAERYRLQEIALLDSNFPVDVRRAIAIARGIHDSSVRFRWTFQASTDFLCRMSDDDARLLGKSGVSHMGFGTESTSAPVLKLMNKRHQRVDEMYETARKAELGGIHVTFNLIFGYPGETESDRLETFRTMSDIAGHFWNVSFSPNIFTPYPGIPIWPELRELGVHEPQSLREWADMPLGTNVLPWLRGEDLSRLRRVLAYFLLNNQIRKATRTFPLLQRSARKFLAAPVRWRLRANRFSFPWELWIARSTEKLVTRRSLLTGETLRTQDVC